MGTETRKGTNCAIYVEQETRHSTMCSESLEVEMRSFEFIRPE